MTSITIELEDSLYQTLEESARLSQRTPAEVVRELIGELQRTQPRPAAAVPGILEIPTLSLGAILQPVGDHSERFEETSFNFTQFVSPVDAVAAPLDSKH